jgi:glycogen debranching enzyme
MKLRVAARVDRADRDYFHEKIEPLFRDPVVEYLGDLGGSDKEEFLGNAHALLFPIDWPEPFGLVMLEAMACGTVDTALVLHFAADYANVFEVRGTHRPARGQNLPGAVEGNAAILAYRGLDGALRRTRLTFTPAPAGLTAANARYDVHLPARGEMAFDLTVACEGPGETTRPLGYDQALARASEELLGTRAACTLYGSNERFNDWVERAAADLHMMCTDTELGPYPYAGVPWFSTPFGRDGIITALECLAFNPAMARGVLGFLAATQATAVVPEQDAQPGKILHETRGGEMAALGEIPFGRYYGSVDSTPLFVMLAGAYLERTADRDFLESIEANVEAALGWIDGYGDPDGDGFVEYARGTPQGLANQGWKDSHDAVFHADGSPAEGPIALCEVQGYAYAARQAGAALARAFGRGRRAEELELQAEAPRQKFEEAFWCEDLSTYALALDGAKRPCRVRTSNAGHCLFSGIADPERARLTARALLGADSFSGWGVRTVAGGEVRYNPMSYHNGSVWADWSRSPAPAAARLLAPPPGRSPSAPVSTTLSCSCRPRPPRRRPTLAARPDCPGGPPARAAPTGPQGPCVQIDAGVESVSLGVEPHHGL